jgi:predicted small secreted protein
MKKLLMTILLVVVFVFLAGCAPTGSGNSGEDVVGSFEWARKIAEEVRDAELPDAPCYSITSYSVDGTGKIRQGGQLVSCV